MKHTYLYRYTGSLELWLLVRDSPADLSCTPALDAPDQAWVDYAAACDLHAAHWDRLMAAIKDAPRAMLGRRYALPGSEDPDRPLLEEGVSMTTRVVTETLWDAPVMTQGIADRISLYLQQEKDDTATEHRELAALLRAAAATGDRVIPVWM